MRRIYDSGALHRDDDEPHAPAEGEDRTPQAVRWLPGAAVSRLFVPDWLRYRAISVDVETPREEYSVGESVSIHVTMSNAMPFPITIRTASPVRWTWSVDGALEASRVPQSDPPDDPHSFRFGRGERKRFTRRWNGMFRVSNSEWEPATPGEYAISAAVNVDDPAAGGLADETTVRLTPSDRSP
ncbi:hypothetical protein AB7C87_04125 [Natrarchaeobius sp. A-rgal3]|uniref:hypothetical protein n=1 Tax=Natrarchaeobius versutus TaxID=1679078 RepID=UPI00350FAB66